MAHKVVVGTRHPKSRVHHDYSTVVSRTVLGAGFLYLVAVLFDLWILWFGRSAADVPQEWFALTGTAEAFPRLIVATALIYVGFFVGEDAGPVTYRVLAGWLLGLGLGALVVLVLLGLNYPEMAAELEGEVWNLFRGSVVKAIGLTVLSVASLLPLGILGFSTRKR